MKGWWPELCSRKILSYYSQQQSPKRLLKKKVFLKISLNSQENKYAVYCPFVFIENLTFPSSISFPINMEGSKRTTTRIGHLYSSTKNKQQNKKDTTLWQKVHYGSNPWENLWPWLQKWKNNSTLRKIKDCRQHALVNCVNWALKVGRLLVTVRVLNVQRLE